MTTDEVLDAIARERARLLAAVDALGPAASTLAVTEEGWTTKDVLAHLTHWATQIAFGLGAHVQPPVYMLRERERRRRAGLSDHMPGADESNALAVAHYKCWPLEDVRRDFEAVVDVLAARARLRTDDDMDATDAIAWAGRRPLWQQIGGDTFLHWPSHAHDIECASHHRPPPLTTHHSPHHHSPASRTQPTTHHSPFTIHHSSPLTTNQLLPSPP